MNIAIIGYTGRAGSRIMKEALDRGHHVRSVGRKEDADVSKNLFELETNDLKDVDVLISAFGTWDDFSLHTKAAKHLNTVAKALDLPWYTVGGAGSLFVAEGLQLVDTPDFPEAYKGVAKGMTDALNYLQDEADSKWSFFSPPAIFEPGKRTGTYKFGDNFLLADSQGNSYISMEDYAIAMMDAVEELKFIGRRFTAVQGQ